MEEDTVVVVVDPRAFIEWKELADVIEMIERSIDILWQAVLDAVHDVADLVQIIQGTAEECTAEETQKRPKYGPATSSCSCLVLLRLDLLPYYSTGFE